MAPCLLESISVKVGTGLRCIQKVSQLSIVTPPFTLYGQVSEITCFFWGLQPPLDPGTVCLLPGETVP